MKNITIEILRYNPEKDDAPEFKSYEVPYDYDNSILDVLNYIKDKIDGSLTYRWSCRMAICGSCGVVVNGKPKLACKAFVREYVDSNKSIKIEPMNNFPIEKDLVPVIDDVVVQKFKKIKPYIINDGSKDTKQSASQLLKFRQYSLCINCLLCYSACPQYGLNSEFTGPAALALVQRYNTDSRDSAKRTRIEDACSDEGVWGCTAVGVCSDVCPKGVDPAAAIQQLKADTALDSVISIFSKK